MVFCVGGAVQDFLFFVDDMPTRPEKYRAKDFLTIGGGVAATASVAVARLGGKAYLASRLGDDALASAIVHDLESYGVDTRYMRRFAGRNSPLSAIFIDAAGERLIVGYKDNQMPDGDEDLPDPLPDEVDAVLCDTRWTHGAEDMMRRAKSAGKPRILDGEPPFTGLETVLSLCTHIIFSAQGLKELTGVEGLEAGLLAARGWCDGWLAVTDGPNGVYFLEDGHVHHMDTPQVAVVDTLGAGDTWHGAFAVAIAEGKSERAAITFANAAAALKCTKKGGRAGVPDRAETDAFLNQLAAQA